MGEPKYIRMLGANVAAEVNDNPDDYGGAETTARFASDEIRRGRIGGIMLGRTRWTTPEDIAEWIASCRVEAAQAV